jgi:hypothetical protein
VVSGYYRETKPPTEEAGGDDDDAFFLVFGERRSELNATAGRILLLRVMCPKIMWRQFPPNLEKNPPQNYVAAVVPAESQKESAPKGSSSRRNILLRLYVVGFVHWK